MNRNREIWTNSPAQRREQSNSLSTQVVVLQDGAFRAYRPRKGDHTSRAAKRFARAHNGRIINL